MQIHITIDPDKDTQHGEILAVLAQALGSAGTVAGLVKLAPQGKTPAKKAAKRMDTVQDDKTLEETGWVPMAGKEEHSEGTPTFAQLQTKAKEVVKAGKREAYKAALARFDATKLAEVKEASYASFGVALDALLEG